MKIGDHVTITSSPARTCTATGIIVSDEMTLKWADGWSGQVRVIDLDKPFETKTKEGVVIYCVVCHVDYIKVDHHHTWAYHMIEPVIYRVCRECGLGQSLTYTGDDPLEWKEIPNLQSFLPELYRILHKEENCEHEWKAYTVFDRARRHCGKCGQTEMFTTNEKGDWVWLPVDEG